MHTQILCTEKLRSAYLCACLSVCVYVWMIRIGRNALKEYSSSTVTKGTIDNIRVSSNPSNTSIHIVMVIVTDILYTAKYSRGKLCGLCNFFTSNSSLAIGTDYQKSCYHKSFPVSIHFLFLTAKVLLYKDIHTVYVQIFKDINFKF